MITGIQITGMVFALVMLYLTYLHYRRKELTREPYYFWQAVWILVLVMLLFPSLLAPVQQTLQITRIFDLLVILGLFFLLALTYYNFVVIRRLQLRMERMVRNIAREGEEQTRPARRPAAAKRR